MAIFTRFTGYARCQLVLINPAKNRRRIYFLEICQGLFHVVLSRAWGRIGYRVRCKEEWYTEIEDAVREANRLYRQKTRKGYQETTLK